MFLNRTNKPVVITVDGVDGGGIWFKTNAQQYFSDELKNRIQQAGGAKAEVSYFLPFHMMDFALYPQPSSDGKIQAW